MTARRCVVAVFFLGSRMGRVLCYGVVGVDHLLQVSRYPEPNGHARVRRDEIQIGGEAANTAIRLSQMGVPVTLMGNPVGSDSLGCYFLDQIGRHEVDCRVEVQEGQTGRAYVVSDSEGTRTIFGAFGDLDAPAVPDLLWSDLDLVSLDPFVEGAVTVGRLAREKGIPVVSIEVEPDCPFATISDTIINSAGFLRRHESGDPQDIAQRLLERGVGSVIVTKGSKGADFYSEGQAFHQPIHPVEVVDTTGAGDGFRAGFVTGLVTGRSLPECVRLASVVGALSCCYYGGCGGEIVLDEALEAAGLA